MVYNLYLLPSESEFSLYGVYGLELCGLLPIMFVLFYRVDSFYVTCDSHGVRKQFALPPPPRLRRCRSRCRRLSRRRRRRRPPKAGAYPRSARGNPAQRRRLAPSPNASDEAAPPVITQELRICVLRRCKMYVNDQFGGQRRGGSTCDSAPPVAARGRTGGLSSLRPVMGRASER